MITLSENIRSLCENRTLAVGDILDTSSVNFDPIRSIGRIRKVKDDGNYTVEYPDGEIGVLKAPKEIRLLDNSMYKEYVDKARESLENNTELSVGKIIHKVNHWIKKNKKKHPPKKPWENLLMPKQRIARELLRVTEGFADAIPSSIHKKGEERDLWLPLTKNIGELQDTNGRLVPTNGPLAIKVSSISSSFAELGEVEEDQVTQTYTVATKDLLSKGILFR